MQEGTPRPLDDWIDELFLGTRPASCLFRVDAGRVPGLSFGHASRCALLARCLRRRWRTRSVGLVRAWPEGVAYLRQRLDKILLLPTEVGLEEEATRTMATIDAGQHDWLIVDLPYKDLDVGYFEAVQEQGTRVLFIDDVRYMVPAADVLLNSDVRAPERVGAGGMEGPKRFLGPRYLPFDPTNEMVSSDDVGILVTLGGSDPTGLTGKVVAAVNEMIGGTERRMTVVLGPGFGDAGKVMEVAGKGEQIMVLRAPENLDALIQAAEVVVTSGGRTLYEAYAHGRPVLPIATAEHEVGTVESFRRKGLIGYGLTRWDPDVFRRHLLEMTETMG